MPVAAVIAGGRPRISSGSSAAALGIMLASITPLLAWVSLSEITAMQVPSEPVPAVVGMANSGSAGSLHLFAPLQSSAVQPLALASATTLAQSMEEPPPKASTASQACSLSIMMPSFTTCAVGSGSTPS